MSGLKKSQSNITIGDGGEVPVGIGASVRRYWLPLAVVAVVVAVVAPAVIYGMIVANRPTLEEQLAVNKSTQAAHGFKEMSEEYALSRMNVAVQYSYDKKCTEARAIVNDVTGSKNGMRPIDLQQYQKKIDSLCPGT